MKKEVIFINSHPIQYFAPLYKYLNENGIKTSAWYCTDKTIKGNIDKEFGVEVKWDIPLLEGYDHKFFKNYAPKPTHEGGFFGLVNLGLVKHLFAIPKSVIVVHGWHYFTHSLVILLAKLRGHTVCLRYEMPYNQEVLKTGWKQNIKRKFLKNVLFSRLSYFLFIGTQNQQLYRNIYKLSPSRLLFCPYSVDNTRFTRQYNQMNGDKAILREKLGIPAHAKVILYSGKYIDKKRPFDVLQAFKALADVNCWLIMLGEGELRRKMEKYIADYHLFNVVLTGFVNQSQVAEFYAVSDCFVMCSTIGETWGLSVNEALNFRLPVVVSDLTGSSIDLVEPGVNGYIFKTGDIEDLTDKLKLVLYKNGFNEVATSHRLLEKYSYQSIATTLKAII